jgi:hypothetical protein
VCRTAGAGIPPKPNRAHLCIFSKPSRPWHYRSRLYVHSHSGSLPLDGNASGCRLPQGTLVLRSGLQRLLDVACNTPARVSRQLRRRPVSRG